MCCLCEPLLHWMLWSYANEKVIIHALICNMILKLLCTQWLRCCYGSIYEFYWRLDLTSFAVLLYITKYKNRIWCWYYRIPVQVKSMRPEFGYFLLKGWEWIWWVRELAAEGSLSAFQHSLGSSKPTWSVVYTFITGRRRCSMQDAKCQAGQGVTSKLKKHRVKYRMHQTTTPNNKSILYLTALSLICSSRG